MALYPYGLMGCFRCMSFPAQVYRLFIASPSDVEEERQVVRDVLADWNAIHSDSRKIVLLPVGWDTHTIPHMDGRPQEVINRTALKDCDFLVGIFWNRLGSDAGKGLTGSVEEIREHVAASKPAMIFFSTKPSKPAHASDRQIVDAFKDEIQTKHQGQYGRFKDAADLRNKLTKFIAILMERKASSTVLPAVSLKGEPTHHEDFNGDTPVAVEFRARSNRMRTSEGEYRSMSFRWSELLLMLWPLIVSGALKPTIKKELESELLKRLQIEGAKTTYGTDYNYVDVSDGQFASIAQHLIECGLADQDQVSMSGTEMGRKTHKTLVSKRSDNRQA